MLKDVVEVRPLPGHRLCVRFEDGVAGEVDVAGLIAAARRAALRARDLPSIVATCRVEVMSFDIGNTGELLLWRSDDRSRLCLTCHDKGFDPAAATP